MTYKDKLTPEQEELIPVYRQKWREVTFSCEPISHNRAKEAIKEAYATMGKAEPEILFFSSPKALAEMMGQESPQRLARQLGTPWPISLQASLCDRIETGLEKKLWQELQEHFFDQPLLMWRLGFQSSATLEYVNMWGEMWEEWGKERELIAWELYQASLRKQVSELPGGDLFLEMGDFFWKEVGEPISQELEEIFWKPLMNLEPIRLWEEEWKPGIIGALNLADLAVKTGWNAIRDLSTNPELIDFCINVLNCPYDRQEWNSFQALVRECGSFMLFEKSCIICDRPTKLLFDEEERFHAEAEPAIEFSDGYHLYYFHGTSLPERYGRLHPHQWQSRWLLSEPNAEIRRLLIQEIGYARLCQELQAVSLDTWREYELLKIEEEVDVEPIHLLKMTCPSTGSIHALRVPPDLTSAREAIRWANWDIDPEEFSVET